jgi:cytochrome d ubiquinol oxidase subunit II
MVELWYAIVAATIIVYVVLDGFDLGAGALHRMLAKSDDERREIIGAIGPYWDANEVWLIAFGGVLFAAFPRVLASGLSGFYLAIFLVVWSLILRAIAIELRSHLNDRVWRSFWDSTLVFASALLPLLFGVALGNVIRGVPLTQDGWFQLTLFTTFRPRPPVGILDVYTVLVGLFALVAVSAHGAAFLAWQTSGAVSERSRRVAFRGLLLTAVLWPIVTLSTHAVNPALLSALPGRPLAWLGLAFGLAGLGLALGSVRRPGPRSFLGTSAFLLGMLTATAACLYPALLPSIAASPSLTVFNASSDEYALRSAWGWWRLAIPFVLAQFVWLFWLHRRQPARDVHAARVPPSESY